MSKIIRLTESQLKKIISNIIKENSTNNISELAFVPKTSNTQTSQSQNLPSFQQQMGTISKPNVSCIGFASPATYKDVVGFNNETIRFFQTGRFADVKGQKGSFSCSSTQKNIVEMMYDSDPTAIRYFNLEKPMEKSVPKKTVFVANEKLPLKFGQKGNNIKLLQNQLGIIPETGQFWTKTEIAIKSKAPEYKRAIGVTEDIWKKIFSSGSKSPIKSVTPSVKSVDTSVTPNIPSSLKSV